MMKTTWLCGVIVLALGCSASRRQPAPSPDPIAVASARVLFAGVQAAWNRQDANGVVSFCTDDIVVVGAAPNCMGEPCIGKPAVIDKMLLHGAFPVIVDWQYVGMRDGMYEFAWFADWPLPGVVVHTRGFDTVALRDGRIARWYVRHDLTDPEMVLLLNHIGELLFSLQAPGIDTVSTARGELRRKADTTVVQVFVPDLAPTGLNLQIRRGPCKQVGQLVHQLEPVLYGRSDTQLDAPFDTIKTKDLSLVVYGADGRIALCGDIP